MKDLKLTHVSEPDLFGQGRMDISYNNLGDVEIVEGLDFLNQGIQKLVMTSARFEHLYPDYGAYIHNIVQQKFGDSITKSFAIRAIESAIDSYISLQVTSEQTFTYEDTEIVIDVQNIMIQQESTDRSKYFLQVYLNTKEGQQTLSFTL